MVRVTVPLPLPLAPFVAVIQLTCGVVVQVQPAAVVTVTLLVAPSAGTLLNVVGLTWYVHPLAWFTVKVWPPMVIVPDRAGPVVASTLYRTEPLPVSLAPEVISIHGTLLTAVHAHPPAAVTVTDAFLIPSSETFALVAEIEIEQPLA